MYPASTAETTGRVDDLSLSECESYDPSPRLQGGCKRFKCPRHGGDNQKSLSVNEADGKFRCYQASCGIWGILTDFKQTGRNAGGWGRSPMWGGGSTKPLPKAEPSVPNEYAVARAVSAWKVFVGSPAQDYARRRGVPDDLAKSLHLGYFRGEWLDTDSEWLTFPLRCPVTGRPVGIFGRNIHSDEQNLKGRLLGYGLFGAAAPGPMPDDVLITEGPFDALALLTNGELPPARALMGSSARAEWFDHCARLTVLLDDDQAGRSAADRLTAELDRRRSRRGIGPKVLVLRHNALQQKYGVKDLGDLLRKKVPIKLGLPPLAPSNQPVETKQSVSLDTSPLVEPCDQDEPTEFDNVALSIFKALRSRSYSKQDAECLIRHHVPYNDLPAAKAFLAAVCAGDFQPIETEDKDR